MKKMGSVFSLLFILFTFSLRAQTPDKLFKAGTKAFQDGLFSIAARNFEALTDQFPDHALADDAEYLQGVSDFYLKHYGKTIPAFKNFRFKYPRSPYLKRISFWLGYSYFRLLQYEEAVRSLSYQIKNYPVETYFFNQALILKGKALEKLERWREAAAAYKELINQEEGHEYHPDALFRLGAIFLRLNEYQNALSSFTTILVDYPDSNIVPEALFFAGESFFYMGKMDKADQRYMRVFEIQSDTAHRETIFFRLIHIHSELKNFSEALSWCRKLEQEFPEGKYKKKIPRLKADLIFDSKRYDDAAVLYDEALQFASISQEKQVILYNLGLSNLLKGDREAALVPFEQAAEGDNDIGEKSLYQLGKILLEIEQDKKAISSFEQFLERFPSSSYSEVAERLLGSLYERNCLYTESSDSFSELLSMYPNSPFRDEYLFRRGNSSLGLNDTSSALRDFFHLISEYPDSSFREESNYNIGYIYSIRGEYKRALPYYQVIIERGENKELFERALLAIGVCYFNSGDYEEASLRFREISDTYSPWAGDGWFYLGRTQVKLGQLQNAVISFKKAARLLNSTDTGEEALFWQALIEFRLDHLEKSRDIFLSLIEQYSGGKRSLESLYRAGLCESLSGRYTESIRYFDLYLGKEINNKAFTPEVLFQKGWSLYKLDRIADAYNIFEILVHDFPDNILAQEAYYKVAEAEFKKGNFTRALDGFTKILSDYPKSSTGISALYWAGASASGLGDTKKALDYYFRFLESSTTGGLSLSAEEDIRTILSSSKDLKTISDFFSRVENSRTVPKDLKNQVRFEYARFIFKDEEEEAYRILKILHESELESSLAGEVDFMIGEYFLKSKNLDRALDIFTGITDSSTGLTGAAAQLKIGSILEQKGIYSEAAEEYLKVYFLYPDIKQHAAEGLYRAAELFSLLEKTAKAESLLKKLKTEFPDSDWANK